MTATLHGRRGPVYFCFAAPAGFSGQKAATELVMRGLSGRGWECRPMPQPVLARGLRGSTAPVRYLLGVGTAWLRALHLLGARGGWLCVNLGQTRAAFLRDGIPLLLGRAGLGRRRVVISLHGSLFMQWADDSLNARLLGFLLRQAGTITVLGEGQRARLHRLGLPRARTMIVVNSCELEPALPAAVRAKHAPAGRADPVVRCLHLSSLIDTKGFPEYLEALRRLSARPGPRIEAVLCGRLVGSEFSSRFTDEAAAEAWIEEQIGECNRGTRVRVRWVRGAAGADKAALFHAADVFVLPTRYPVEAQPLVLLEAMAAGCAIVTTRAGEIGTILDEQCAVFLATPSAEALATVLEGLVGDPGARLRLALAAHARYADRYQLGRHLDGWETLLATAGPGTLPQS